MANVVGDDSAELINWMDGVTHGADNIFGFGGNDTIWGLSGDDLIKGGGGADALHGGAGSDTATYVDSAVGVTVSLVAGQGFGGTAEGDTLTGIENLIGSDHDDTLVGGSAANVLTGGDGHDTLKGGGGADTLDGGEGDDTLVGGAGADVLNGGYGSNTASYFDSDAGVNVLLGAGIATGGHAEGDSLSGILNLTGSGLDDLLRGNDAVNVLRGGGGDDTLDGLAGSDTLEGQEGDDLIFGDVGADTLRGGNGSDYLNGGAGGDILQGGAGVDWLSYSGSSAGILINLGNGQAMGGHADGDSFTGIENVHGSSYADSLFGDGLANIIEGHGGDDFLFGNAGNDTFAFSEEFNHDTILDFAPGSDEIQFATEVFANWAQVQANAVQIGNDVVITAEGSGTVTLQNVMLASLAATDFSFV